MRLGTKHLGWPVAAVLAALAILTLSTAARAAEFRTGGRVVIPAGDTLRDDLYVCGGKVDIDGVVLGSLVVRETLRLAEKVKAKLERQLT